MRPTNSNEKEESKSFKLSKEDLKEVNLISINEILEAEISLYKNRKKIETDYPNLFQNEPKNESETILLLQSMISLNHPNIDFKIGQYNVRFDRELYLDFFSEGIIKSELAQVVYNLTNLFEELNSYIGFTKVICWEIGDISDFNEEILEYHYNMYFGFGSNGKILDPENKYYYLELIPDNEEKGKYTFNFKGDLINVYVLKEILYKK